MPRDQERGGTQRPREGVNTESVETDFEMGRQDIGRDFEPNVGEGARASEEGRDKAPHVPRDEAEEAFRATHRDTPEEPD